MIKGINMADKIDNREDSMLMPDQISMINEFTDGKAIGESGHVEGLSDQFSWKRAFVNCWTGRPNCGKSTFLNFMAINKSKHDKWKWCIWSPEMINSYKMGKKIVKSSSDIYDELIHTFSGKNPYKHFTQKYGIPQMTLEEYREALYWVQDHFYVMNPKDKNYKSLIDTFNYWYEKEGFDGWIIDPFKNVRYDQTGTTDNVLHAIFDEFNEISIYTNSTINIITHPRSTNEPRVKEGKNKGAYKVITQHDLLGGSAWDNSMDGIFSLHRPFMHIDPNDVRTELYHLKQRKKHLVGETGVYRRIEYNMIKNRYYFDGHCPIDGSFQEPIGKKGMKPKSVIQNGIEFKPIEHDKAPF